MNALVRKNKLNIPMEENTYPPYNEYKYFATLKDFFYFYFLFSLVLFSDLIHFLFYLIYLY